MNITSLKVDEKARLRIPLDFLNVFWENIKDFILFDKSKIWKHFLLLPYNQDLLTTLSSIIPINQINNDDVLDSLSLKIKEVKIDKYQRIWLESDAKKSELILSLSIKKNYINIIDQECYQYLSNIESPLIE